MIDKTLNQKTIHKNSIEKCECDRFYMRSSLYSRPIRLDGLDLLSDKNNLVSKYGLSLELFNNPFDISVILIDFDETTINIINQLDDNFNIKIIISDLNKNITEHQKVEFLSKVVHSNCNLSMGHCSLDEISNILNKFKSFFDTFIDINEVNKNTIECVEEFADLFKANPINFEIYINNFESLKNLNEIFRYINPKSSSIYLNDNLFLEPNFEKSKLIVDGSKNIVPKDVDVHFRGSWYENFDELIELERLLEIVRAHIPSDASKLDIVTYVSLFIINYFEYDHDDYIENYVNECNDLLKSDINLTEFCFIKKGVCRHYAEFTTYLLNSLNVRCQTLSSDGLRNDSGHAFNVVEINNKMYLLDNTWLASAFQDGIINSLADCSYFLTSNTDFEHEEYADAFGQYFCETLDRNLIKKSQNEVECWGQNYKIHSNALECLFAKHLIDIDKMTKIEQAIPRRK